jgi:hypothetical protein
MNGYFALERRNVESAFFLSSPSTNEAWPILFSFIRLSLVLISNDISWFYLPDLRYLSSSKL